jgi:hypothetical protein
MSNMTINPVNRKHSRTGIQGIIESHRSLCVGEREISVVTILYGRIGMFGYFSVSEPWSNERFL